LLGERGTTGMLKAQELMTRKLSPDEPEEADEVVWIVDRARVLEVIVRAA
jgi:hypothetical protein